MTFGNGYGTTRVFVERRFVYSKVFSKETCYAQTPCISFLTFIELVFLRHARVTTKELTMKITYNQIHHNIGVFNSIYFSSVWLTWTKWFYGPPNNWVVITNKLETLLRLITTQKEKILQEIFRTIFGHL